MKSLIKWKKYWGKETKTWGAWGETPEWISVGTWNFNISHIIPEKEDKGIRASAANFKKREYLLLGFFDTIKEAKLFSEKTVCEWEERSDK